MRRFYVLFVACFLVLALSSVSDASTRYFDQLGNEVSYEQYQEILKNWYARIQEIEAKKAELARKQRDAETKQAAAIAPKAVTVMKTMPVYRPPKPVQSTYTPPARSTYSSPSYSGYSSPSYSRSSSSSGKTVHVKGHYRTSKSGKRTWVKAHTRSAPKR